MRTIVIYDSQFGNTGRIAQAIAGALSAPAVRAAEASSLSFTGVELLILGCPTQSWKPTPAMRAFLAGLTPAQLRGLAAACFDTRYKSSPWLTGAAANVIARRLRALRVPVLAPPESFFVQGVEGPLYQGEAERATAWAHTLAARREASRTRP